MTYRIKTTWLKMPGNAQVREGQIPGKDHCALVVKGRDREKQRQRLNTEPGVTRPSFELQLHHLRELCESRTNYQGKVVVGDTERVNVKMLG